MLSENLKGREHSGDLGIDGRRMMLDWILWKQCANTCTGCILLRTGTRGRTLWTW